MNDDDLYIYFDVAGAGKIQLTRNSNSRTMNVQGFSFGVEWGQNGYTGGVLSKEEAIRLANFILRTVNLDQLIGDK